MLRFLVLSLLFTGVSFSCRQNNEQSVPGTPRIPVVEEDWWRICEMPDLDSLAGPDPERQHIVDHGFIRAENGKWQLWACIRGTAAGRLLYRWQGQSLERGPWEPAGIAARANAAYGEKTKPEESIQAPFFMNLKDGYYCFYNSNGARVMRSQDGINYERFDLQHGNNIMYKESGRDVMLLKENGKFLCYSTVSTVAADGWKYGFIIVRSSEDLKRWSDYTIISSGGIAGNGPISAESPFVIKTDGYYYLFRSSSVTGKCYVYRSQNPYDFGVNNDSGLVTTLPIRAPEIIEHKGMYFISDLSDFRGIKLARLNFLPDPD